MKDEEFVQNLEYLANPLKNFPNEAWAAFAYWITTQVVSITIYLFSGKKRARRYKRRRL